MYNENIARLAARRYQNYLKVEKKKRYSKWFEKIIFAILMLVKLITIKLEKANLKGKRAFEKVSVD